MKILIDISHPAHVHFYRHIRQRLVDDGADVLVIAREKDVTLSLLQAFGIPHLSIGRSGHRGWSGQFAELLTRDAFLAREGRRFAPDVILTRNPSGVQAARLLRTTGVFDTDDGRSVGVHYRAAAPFAHVITAPDCLPESFGSKERRYPSYKSLAYLHPAVFTPEPGIRAELGIGADDRYSILRLVAHDASHDRKARGIDAEGARQIITLLARYGSVFISSEGDLAPDIAELRLNIRSESIHSVLAEASMVVGDSQTIATEAALLATPSIRINTWVDSSPYLTELEKRYRLAFSYAPGHLERALLHIKQLMEDQDTLGRWVIRREQMLEDKVDLASWYYDFVVDTVG